MAPCLHPSRRACRPSYVPTWSPPPPHHSRTCSPGSPTRPEKAREKRLTPSVILDQQVWRRGRGRGGAGARTSGAGLDLAHKNQRATMARCKCAVTRLPGAASYLTPVRTTDDRHVGWTTIGDRRHAGIAALRAAVCGRPSADLLRSSRQLFERVSSGKETGWKLNGSGDRCQSLDALRMDEQVLLR